MMGKRGSPCMEYGGDADPGTEMLGISGDREHRIGRGLEQQIIDQRFVMIGDGGDLGRHREHDVEVADREKVGLAGLEPGARGGALASWTVRSEEHTSELQSLMRISYAVFCLKTTTKQPPHAH